MHNQIFQIDHLSNVKEHGKYFLTAIVEGYKRKEDAMPCPKYMYS